MTRPSAIDMCVNAFLDTHERFSYGDIFARMKEKKKEDSTWKRTCHVRGQHSAGDELGKERGPLVSTMYFSSCEPPSTWKRGMLFLSGTFLHCLYIDVAD